MSVIPVAWLVLSIEYSNRSNWITRRTVAAVSLVPAVTVVVAWSGASDLLWRVHGLTTVDSFVVLEISRGPWFYVWATYSYLLVGVGTVVILHSVLRARNVYLNQVAMILVAVFVPWIGNALALANLNPLPLDPTPFLFTISGVAFAVAIFRFGLFDLGPLARDRVIQEMEDAVIVLDDANGIVDVNSAAAEIVDRDASWMIGRSAGDFFFGEYADRYRDATGDSETIVVDQFDETRIFELNVSPLHSLRGTVEGQLILLRDVTRLEEQREQLQRQNDQLEEFAGIVSHDLRNPLSLATSSLELVDEEYKDEQFDTVEDALEDATGLIEDLLTLAREGQVVEETEPISLGTLVTAAMPVELSGTDVVVEDEQLTIAGDPGRVQQLFGILFQNAVEHGSTTPDSHHRRDAVEHRSKGDRYSSGDGAESGHSNATIRVGPLEEGRGIYVEDDGPGIPPAERERVFDVGYTRSSSGTGLGLAIVQNIANAHGWAVSVREGRTGGARFEITAGTSPVTVEDATVLKRTE